MLCATRCLVSVASIIVKVIDGLLLIEIDALMLFEVFRKDIDVTMS